MENKKTYIIEINGVEQSIDAVKALNAQLEALESRIKSLEGKAVGIKTSGGGSKTSSTSSLSEEEKLERQIAQLDEKRVAYSQELYQNYLAAKDVLKETVNDQKQLAAAERIQADNYSNTMTGIKQKLADLKSVHFTTDISTDEFKNQTTEINALTEKLKQLEAEYGVYSRNVGNYKSAAEGFTAVINGQEQSFGRLSRALMALSNAMAQIPEEARETSEEFKNLSEQYKELNKLEEQMKRIQNDLKATSDGLNLLMDTFEGFSAIASVGTGVQAFFGIDNDEIQRSIQKLVALQNTLQGIEKLRQMMRSGQFPLDKYLGFDKIDAANYKLKKLIVSLQGTGTSAKFAASCVNLLSSAAKALASIGIVALISAAVYGMEKAVEWVGEWIKGDADLVNAEDALTASISHQNEVLDKNLDLIQKRVNAGEITAEQARNEREDAYAKAIEETNKKLLEREEIYRKSGIVQSNKTDLYLGNAVGDKGVTTIGGFDEGIKGIEDFTKRWDLLSSAVENGTDALNKWNYTASDAKDDFVHMIKLVGGDMVNAFNKFADGSKEGTKQLVEYINHMDELTSGRYTEALKIGIDKGFLDGQFKQAFDLYNNLRENVYKTPIVAKLELDAKINSDLNRLFPKDTLQKQIDEYNELLEKGVNEAGQTITMAERANISKIIKGLEEQKNKINQKTNSNYKKLGKEIQSAENELTRLRIAQMKEGLNKTITQLEEERKAKIAKIKLDGKMVGELTLETNRYYDQKIEDAKKEHAENIEQIYNSMWEKINADALANTKKERKNIEDDWDYINRVNERASKYDKNSASYGIQGKNQFSKSTQRSLGIVSEEKSSFMTGMKKYIDMYREIQTVMNEATAAEYKFENKNKKLTDEELARLNLEIDKKNNNYNKLKKQYVEYGKLLKEKYGEELFNYTKEALLEESYSSSLAVQFGQRMSLIEKYWSKRKNLETDAAEEIYNKRIEEENVAYAVESANTKAHYDAIDKQIHDNLEKGLITTAEFEKELFANALNYQKADEELRREHSNNQTKIEEEKYEKLRKINGEYYQDVLQELRDFQTATNNLEQKQPVINIWGIVNLKETNKNNENLRKSYEELLNKIKEKRREINSDFQKGLIDKNILDGTIREFDNTSNAIAEKMGKIRHELSLGGQIEQLADGINQWVQQVGQAANSILSSISEIESNHYADRIAKQEKYIEEYEKLLDKQKDATQKYADAVKDIEDELSTARGDRRQQLIDNLNAEMAAQRASLAQEKKIEKEKQKADDEKKRLEDEQALRKWEMDKAQAYINAAMAVSMAAVNKWPIPAIPMMAMAAAVGAAQIAAVISAKPKKYGTGGVIQGKSHAAGGVKAVVGGKYPVELEGQEYVIRKATATSNIEVLDFINKSERKLKLDDFIDFYTGGRARRNIISSSPRSKYAEGGQVIPTLRTDFDINNRLLTAFEDYSNRDVVVSVVDINDRQAAVNNVKVLAGLDA